MKVYTEEVDEPYEDIPMNLAAPQENILSEDMSAEKIGPSVDVILEEVAPYNLSVSAPPPSPSLNHCYSNPSPLQSSAITSVIVEPFDRVAINPSPSPSTTPTPTAISPTLGCTTPTLSHLPLSNMAMEEDSPIKPVISSQNLPIKRKIRLEMKTSEDERWDPQQSALHQLAAVAERKQAEEDEMMDIGGTTPIGTPTPGSPSATPPPICIREQPSSTTNLDLHGHLSMNPAGLTPTSVFKQTLSHAHSLPPMSLGEYDLPTSSGPLSFTPSASPLTARHLKSAPAPTPSPDSAIHSTIYSPSQSPGQSRHGPFSGFSSPYHSSHRTTPSLSRNNSDASQYGGSQYSYSSATSPISPPHFSPTHSPVTSSRYSHHPGYPSPALPSSPLPRGGHMSLPLYSHGVILSRHDEEPKREGEDVLADLAQHSALTAQTGISRQQLINSPCPICGDKISGFHYGIFSCESCKGFFKRTVQNKKNYVCLRGAQCPVSIATRKKCPACRFDKCLKMGMKLEAIREDRTRGGRSTYQCSYTIPAGLSAHASLPPGIPEYRTDKERSSKPPEIPNLLQEIMNVEHLWFSNKLQGASDARLDEKRIPRRGVLPPPCGSTSPGPGGPSSTHGALCSGGDGGHGTSSHKGEDIVQTLTMMADQRLYKLVKWCKSLPLFKNILIDDQIALLINAWCELLVLSCCYRSMSHPGVIRVSNDVTLSINTARQHGIEKCVEKMLNFSDQLRRLKVDHYEYVSMKVIVLLTSDASGLKEVDQVRESQEKVVHALQDYTVSHYPDMPSKFGELLLRMPELQRVCQVGKEMLCLNQQPKGENESPGFNFLMELLRGDH